MDLGKGIIEKDFLLYSSYQSTPTDIQQGMWKIADRFKDYLKESISNERTIVNAVEGSRLEVHLNEFRYFDFRGMESFDNMKMYIDLTSRFKVTRIAEIEGQPEFMVKELKPKLKLKLFGEDPEKVEEFYEKLKGIYHPLELFRKKR